MVATYNFGSVYVFLPVVGFVNHLISIFMNINETHISEINHKKPINKRISAQNRFQTTIDASLFFIYIIGDSI